MRAAFIEALCDVAKHDPRIILITGDLGYRYLEKFRDLYPQQFLNIGVSESNLVTVASGLSTLGYIPFIYSIATFASMRAYEHIRNLISLQNLNIKIIGIGGGLAYTKSGITHHSYEDIALMRMLPGMTIIDPLDTNQAYSVTRTIVDHHGPVYIRLEKNPLQPVFRTYPQFEIGKGNILLDQKRHQNFHIVILCTGTKIDLAQSVIQLLMKHQFTMTLIGLPTVRPLDQPLLKKYIHSKTIFVTIEEHQRNGGLGSEVLEWLSEKTFNIPLLRFGFTNQFSSSTGTYEYLMQIHGLTPPQIVKTITSHIARHNRLL